MAQKTVSHQDLVGIKLAMFDLDGTLARKNSMVSDASCQALASLYHAGVQVGIATGRNRISAQRTLARAGIPGYVVSVNGSLTLHCPDERILDVSPMDKSIVQKCWDLDTEYQLDIIVYTDQKMCARYDGPSRRIQTVICGETPAMVSSVAEIYADGAKPLKVLFYKENMDIDQYRGLILRYFPHAVETAPRFLEVSDPQMNKSHGIEYVLKELGLTWEQCLGIGDSENDLGWLPRVGISLCPAGAYDCVKAICDYQIGSNDDDSVAKFIHYWLNPAGADNRN